jgi:putative endonuclease
MTNPRNTALDAGVTNDLARRVQEHKKKLVEGFTKRYNITKLVYFETFADPQSAIAREKPLKGGSRQTNLDLANAINPEWRDLSEEWCWESLSCSLRFG